MSVGLQLSMNQSMRMDQRMILAPQIIQSIEILQLPIMALQERIDQELTENPALELEEGKSEDSEEESEQSGEAETASQETSDSDGDTPSQLGAGEDESSAEENGAADINPEDTVLESRLEELGQEWDEYFSRFSGSSAPKNEEDGKLAALLNTPARSESLHEHLMGQLAFLEIDDDILKLCENIIYSLDTDGRLLYPIADLVAMTGNPEEDAEILNKVEQALKLVQSLEPNGIAFRDIQECLLLQVSDNNGHDLPRLLIQEHLDDLQNNRLPKIVKETGKTLDDVKDAIFFISTLNPHPGSEFTANENQHIQPDVVVEFTEGNYEIRLEDHYVPRLSVSPSYIRMLKDGNCDKATKDYLRTKILNARWMIDAIEQRRRTIRKIAEEIVTRQRDFFEKGVSYLHPLKMQQVGDTVGVHVSTVSRAISGKYVQTERGIFPLKFFFTGGIENAGGGMVSTKSIQQTLVEIVDKEDKANPLSDEEIVARLKEKDMKISRRTVTKYRKQRRIPSSRQRRQY